MDEMLLEIQDAFIVESVDLLASVETLFLQIEKNPQDKANYDQLARLAHNLKGTGKAVGFNEIAELAHEMENLLIALRTDKVPAAPERIDLLLRCVDELKSGLAQLSANRTAPPQFGEVLALLRQAQVESSDSVGGTSSEGPDREPFVAHALATAPKTKPEPIKKANDEHLRIPTQRIEMILDTFGEQVILQSALDQLRLEPVLQRELLDRTVNQLSKLTYDLQREVLRLRMVTLSSLMGKLERASRDAAKMIGKQIEFVAEGGELELDKTIVDAIGDSLVHMVRNSIDHGLESNEERVAAGKSSKGRVQVTARTRGGQFEFAIRDDGKGLDPDRLLKKGIEKGILSPTKSYSKHEILSVIFENGFSTKEATTELSGRGVGMNVVRETVDSLKGSIEIETEAGLGTTFYIRLPQSLAIFNGLVVRLHEQLFVVPASSVNEVVRIPESKVKIQSGKPSLLEVRNEVLPCVDLTSRLVHKPSVIRKGHYTAMISRDSRQAFAVIVDEVQQNQKIVQKKLGSEVKNHEGATSATILGDGSVSLVLDLSVFAPPAVKAA